MSHEKKLRYQSVRQLKDDVERFQVAAGVFRPHSLCDALALNPLEGRPPNRGLHPRRLTQGSARPLPGSRPREATSHAPLARIARLESSNRLDIGSICASPVTLEHGSARYDVGASIANRGHRRSSAMTASPLRPSLFSVPRARPISRRYRSCASFQNDSPGVTMVPALPALLPLTGCSASATTDPSAGPSKDLADQSRGGIS